MSYNNINRTLLVYVTYNTDIKKSKLKKRFMKTTWGVSDPVQPNTNAAMTNYCVEVQTCKLKQIRWLNVHYLPSFLTGDRQDGALFHQEVYGYTAALSPQQS